MVTHKAKRETDMVSLIVIQMWLFEDLMKIVNPEQIFI